MHSSEGFWKHGRKPYENITFVTLGVVCLVCKDKSCVAKPSREGDES